MNSRHSFHLVLAFALMGASSGCEAWKRADARAGQTFAPHVDTVKVGERSLIRIQGRRSVVLIDAEGGRVVDFHTGRRPRTIFEADPYTTDRVRFRQVEQPSGPNVLAEAGWETVCAPCDPRLANRLYWQSDVGKNRVVLISDTRGGLRWRKEFTLADFTGELEIEVMLENMTLHPITVSAASRLATRGELAGTDGEQQASFERQLFSRQLIDGPADATGFEFPERTIPSMKRLVWRERWEIKPESATTRPGHPATRAD